MRPDSHFSTAMPVMALALRRIRLRSSKQGTWPGGLESGRRRSRPAESCRCRPCEKRWKRGKGPNVRLPPAHISMFVKLAKSRQNANGRQSRRPYTIRHVSVK